MAWGAVVMGEEFYPLVTARADPFRRRRTA
jgi:hypothetical protein